MTTFSSISKILLALTFVTAGALGTAEAAPAGKRQLRQAKAKQALAVKRPARADQVVRPTAARVQRATRVAQATPQRATRVAQATPVQARKGERQARRYERMARFDLNKDGQIDEAERLAMKKLRFAKIDTNGDSSISLGEMTAAKEAHKKQRMAKRANNPNKQGKAHKKGNGKGRDQGKRMEKRFAKVDADSNGAISWQEFSAAKSRDRGPKGLRKGRGGGRY